jgi:hypothetical protein
MIILVLTIYWLLSFFGQSIVPGIPHTEGFIDVLSGLIVVLIIIRFWHSCSIHAFILLIGGAVFSKTRLS